MTTKELLDKIDGIKVYKSKLEAYLKNHFPDLHAEVYKKTDFLDKDNIKQWKITFAERMYCLRNGISHIVLCQTCNKNRVKFRTDIREYRKNCSNECSKHSLLTIEQRKKTNLKRHGCEWYSNIDKSRNTRLNHNNGSWHAEDFYEKVQNTMLERYGNKNWNNLEKAKSTSLKRYGYEFPQQNPEIQKQRIRKFAAEHNGISCAFQLPEIVEKTKLGIRKRAWKCIQSSDIVEPLFTEAEFMDIVDVNEKVCMKFRCKACGTEFASNWDNGHACQCPVCFPQLHGTSHQEQELVDYLKSIVDPEKVFNKDRKNKLADGREVDVLVEMTDKKLAIEYDGLYWHSDQYGKNRNYHLSKTEECERNGIQLVHIFENEWLTKKDIVKSRLKSFLGIYDKTIYARSCLVKEVNKKESREFQEKNHIQGSINSKVNFGLYHDDKLISLMTFGKCRYNKRYEWELLRFCNKLGYHVPGAASKLLKQFEDNYSPKSLISYADRRYSMGKLYHALNFKLDHVSSPDYWYFKPQNTSILYSRIRFQKHKLKNLLEKFDESKTEVENMLDNGYYRIFDCGNLVFVKEY